MPRWRWGSPEGRGTESTVQRLRANSNAFVYHTLPPTGSFQCPSDCPDGGGPRIGYTYAREIPICNWGLDARNLYPSLRGSPIAIGATAPLPQGCAPPSGQWHPRRGSRSGIEETPSGEGIVYKCNGIRPTLNSGLCTSLFGAPPSPSGQPHPSLRGVHPRRGNGRVDPPRRGSQRGIEVTPSGEGYINAVVFKHKR